MRYRRLGGSELLVSEVALGSWLTLEGGIPAETARGCVRSALDVGINLFDTANVYGHGAAEAMLGDTLSHFPRSAYMIASKVFYPMSEADAGLSAAQITKQLDGSLQRLNSSYIDLYQCHRWDANTPLEETLEALTRAVRSGRVRYIGFSQWTADQVLASLAVKDVVQFVSSQPQYSLFVRAPEKQLFPVCWEHGIGQLVWSPLAQGVLTGKYVPGLQVPSGSRAASSRMGWGMGRLRDPRIWEAVQELLPIARELHITMAQLALSWVLRRQEVSAAIIGASGPGQIVENAAASGIVLHEEVLTRIDSVVLPVLQRIACRPQENAARRPGATEQV
jgi:aryl-alcohol dehydrogenase-like predicted oxidoreductase